MDKDKALDLALEALKQIYTAMPFPAGSKAITAIKQALAAPVPDVEKWLGQPSYHDGFGRSPDLWSLAQIKVAVTAMIHTPPAAQRQWVGLTDEEIEAIWYDHHDREMGYAMRFARAIEAKLKDKNGLHRQHVIDGSPCWCEPETSYTDPETGASVVVHKEPQ